MENFFHRYNFTLSVPIVTARYCIKKIWDNDPIIEPNEITRFLSVHPKTRMEITFHCDGKYPNVQALKNDKQRIYHFEYDYEPSAKEKEKDNIYITFPENTQSICWKRAKIYCVKQIEFPHYLQILTFGHDFNQSLVGVILPSSLQTLIFGEYYNQSLINVTVPFHCKLSYLEVISIKILWV